ncbi:hypothetical protein [Thermoflexus sp.]|uniref:hypothetical protein n=1 Tax=Thermoflexus sp. TaxID=1969742 RepID=UPI002ADD496F|nr:hypothetical protein [Thermoflexus sp.]
MTRLGSWRVSFFLLSKAWLALSVAMLSAGWLLLRRRTQPAELWQIEGWILIGGLGMALMELFFLIIHLW